MVAECRIPVDGGLVPLEASVGVALAQCDHDTDPMLLVRQADEAMYEAKKAAPRHPGTGLLRPLRAPPPHGERAGDGESCHRGTVPSSSILVTGASTGIGQACAIAFDRLGWHVFAGVRRDEDARRLASTASDRLRPVLLEVTDMDSVDAVAKEIDAAAGDAGLTAVVNNAGIAVGGPVEYLAVDEWRRQFDVNVIGPVAVTRAVLPSIRRSGRRGRIVFIGSIGGRVANPFVAPYAASKHAIEAIAESMRHELASTGIRTVVIEPGAVRTPIWDKGQSAADDIEAALPPEGLERYGPAIGALRKAMQFQAKTGVDPSVVARVVERAVTSPKPAARYVVGREAKATAIAVRFLPDGARDAVMRAGMKLASR